LRANFYEKSWREWADHVESISLYDSMMFIHRQHEKKTIKRILTGTDYISYGKGHHTVQNV
jgi:hypothetical protein